MCVFRFSCVGSFGSLYGSEGGLVVAAAARTLKPTRILELREFACDVTLDVAPPQWKAGHIPEGNLVQYVCVIRVQALWIRSY